MPVHTDRAILRGQRAVTRGLEALGRRAPTFTAPAWTSTENHRRVTERQQRAHLEVLDAGRELVRTSLDLERKAELARRAGIEALRHASPAESWASIGELVGMTGQGTHRRYRDVEDPEPELTIDDELAARHTTGTPA